MEINKPLKLVLPNLNFTNQQFVNENMFRILIDWIYDTCKAFKLPTLSKFKLIINTSYNVVYLINNINNIKRREFQLIGLIGLWFAENKEDIYKFTTDNDEEKLIRMFIFICDSAYDREEILSNILKYSPLFENVYFQPFYNYLSTTCQEIIITNSTKWLVDILMDPKNYISPKDFANKLNLNCSQIERFKPIDKYNLIQWIIRYLYGDRTKGPIGDWDVSHITDMSRVFLNKNFNEPLTNWDVSNVIDMSEMFCGCHNFNQPLNHWNVSNVNNMFGMFQNCYKFNQPLDRWNVSNVTSMRLMFYGCYEFNQSLNTWDVSNVDNMFGTFSNCRQFNQPLDRWNVSNVNNMSEMFNYCEQFNQPLNTWNVSNVTRMCDMFNGCMNFNQPLDRWIVSNVIDMSEMFNGCYKFNQPLNTWNVSNVTNMNEMFYDCKQFNQPLNRWDVSNVTNMSGMFLDCVKFNQPLDSWIVLQVTDMNGMFYNCNDFKQSFNSWTINNTIKWNNVSNQPFILNSRPNVTHLKLKNLKFPNYKKWNDISNLFDTNNPWLIHVETFEDLEYPIVTLPKGMMLYTYSTNKSTNNETFLFNLHKQSIDLQNSLKYFFPIPYAALNIFPHYDYCSIVTLSRNIRLLGLISPSPIYRSYARDIKKYYQKKYLYDCEEPFDYDLCIDFKLKQHLNLEGYIAISVNDSISHGPEWTEQFCNEKNISTEFVTQLILKSCISNHNIEDLSPNNSTNLCLLNSTYKTKVNTIKKVFGIPEIALSPFSNEILNDVKINYKKIFEIFNSTDANKKQTTFNYKKLEMVSSDKVKFYLDSIDSNIVESNQCVLFNLYLPECDTREFPFFHTPKMYNELTLEDVNWLESYQTQTNAIAFNTILYEYFKITDEITDEITGGNKKIKKIKRSLKTKRNLKTKKKGGNVNLLNFPRKTRNRAFKPLLSLKNNNLLSSVKTNKTISIKKTKNPILSSLSSIEKPPSAEQSNNLEKQSKKMICELSKIGIPIIYWKF